MEWVACYYLTDAMGETVYVKLGQVMGPLQISHSIRMNMEPRWNDTDRGKPKDSGKTEGLGENLSQCHFVHHKSHMYCPANGPNHRGEMPATNRLPKETNLRPAGRMRSVKH
jgi:hypothetical protein